MWIYTIVAIRVMMLRRQVGMRTLYRNDRKVECNSILPKIAKISWHHKSLRFYWCAHFESSFLPVLSPVFVSLITLINYHFLRLNKDFLLEVPKVWTFPSTLSHTPPLCGLTTMSLSKDVPSSFVITPEPIYSSTAISKPPPLPCLGM